MVRIFVVVTVTVAVAVVVAVPETVSVSDVDGVYSGMSRIKFNVSFGLKFSEKSSWRFTRRFIAREWTRPLSSICGVEQSRALSTLFVLHARCDGRRRRHYH